MLYFPYLINLLQLITAIIALVYFKNYKNSTEKYFLLFLWVTFITDFSCGILSDYFLVNLYRIYNIYTGISILFYFYWYYSLLKLKLNTKLTFLFSVIYVIVFILNFFQTSPSDGYIDYTFVIGAVFIVILTGFYLYELANSNTIILTKYKLSFWIALALILFYVGMVPFMLLSKYFNIWGESNTFFIILLCLNVILYGCYCIGFIWTKKKYNHF